MTRNIAWISGAALLLTVTLGAWLHPSQTPTAQLVVEPPVPVTVGTVSRRNLSITTEAAGRAEAKASVSVTARVDGQVAEVLYIEGHPVRKGQLLLRLDASALDTQRRQAEGLVARDEAQIARLAADHQRNESLSEQGFISAGALNQSEADLKSAEATRKSDSAALDDARLQVDFTRIRASIDGVAGALQVPPGGAAKANTTTLLVINQIDPIYVTFALPESGLPPLKEALARGAVPVIATIEGAEAPQAGHVAFIDNAVDSATGSITVKALIANPTGLITPGQFARVSVGIGQLSDVLAVPAPAVESGVDGPYAFVVNPDATVSIRQLSVGAEADGFRVVLAGLKEGERVVTDGQARLHNKARITIQSASVPAAGQTR